MSASSPFDMEFWAILIVAGYKGASLLVGLTFGYMGYRLFLAGIERPAGDLEAKSSTGMLKLSGAAPGTFFALFGAAVIATTILQGFDIELPSQARQFLNALPEHPPMAGNE